MRKDPEPGRARYVPSRAGQGRHVGGMGRVGPEELEKKSVIGSYNKRGRFWGAGLECFLQAMALP